jgi:hypothetical protein
MCIVLVGCSPEAAPRVMFRTPAGTQPLDAWYGVFVEPLENGTTDVELVIGFVSPSWGCGPAAPDVDALVFSFPMLGMPPISQTVLARAGPDFGATTGGSGEVDLSAIDARYQEDGPAGPMVGAGGHVDGSIHYEVAPGLLLDGKFRAPHCAVLDFRDAS